MIQSTHEDASFKLLDRAIAGHRLSAGEIRRLYDLPTNASGAAAHELRLRHSNPYLATYRSAAISITRTSASSRADFARSIVPSTRRAPSLSRSMKSRSEMDELRRIGGRDALLRGRHQSRSAVSVVFGFAAVSQIALSGNPYRCVQPEEILGLEKLTGRDAWDILCELKDAGLDGMPGAAAEILVDEVRERTAPTRMKTGDWFRIIDSAMKAGLHNPWVGMVIGFGETLEQRVQHLIALRDQQDRGLERYGAASTSYKVWPARLEAYSPERNHCSCR